MATEAAAARKKLLFDSIYALDNDLSDEYEEDEGLTSSRNNINVQPISPKVKRTPGLVRSASSPFPTQYSRKLKRASALEMLEDAAAVKDTPVQRLRKSATTTGVVSLTRPSSDLQMPPSSTISEAGVKRKRDSEVVKETPAPALRKSAISAIASSPIISKTKPLPSLRKSATVTGVETTKDLIMPTSSAIPRLPGKKKGEAKINLVSEDQRVFSGLHFCMTWYDHLHHAITNTIQFSSPTMTSTLAVV